MLNNDKSFKKLMTLLGSIDPKNPLPVELEGYLLLWMMAEPYCKKERTLEFLDEVPRNAYYVVHGLVKVYAWNRNGYRYLCRIYREGTIVALKCFMDQKESEYEIVACRNTLIWSISAKHMQTMYDSMAKMREMALNTALLYSEAKEQVRSGLLALGIDERVVGFYTLFPGLLPARTAPIRHVDIADYLMLTPAELKQSRRRMIIGRMY